MTTAGAYALVQELQHVFTNPEEESGLTELEYAERDGVILIPRIYMIWRAIRCFLPTFSTLVHKKLKKYLSSRSTNQTVLYACTQIYLLSEMIEITCLL